MVWFVVVDDYFLSLNCSGEVVKFFVRICYVLFFFTVNNVHFSGDEHIKPCFVMNKL